METLENNRAREAICHVSQVDLTPEHIAVAFLLQRFNQLTKESFGDIVSLMEAWTNPNTPADDLPGIFETIRQILFPELIGEIRQIPGDTTEQLPERLRCRAEYIAKAIKKKRDEKEWTQTQLADKSGLQQSHISRLEAGVHSPSWKTLEKIAKALGVEVGDLDPSN